MTTVNSGIKMKMFLLKVKCTFKIFQILADFSTTKIICLLSILQFSINIFPIMSKSESLYIFVVVKKNSTMYAMDKKIISEV